MGELVQMLIAIQKFNNQRMDIGWIAGMTSSFFDQSLEQLIVVRCELGSALKTLRKCKESFS